MLVFFLFEISFAKVTLKSWKPLKPNFLVNLVMVASPTPDSLAIIDIDLYIILSKSDFIYSINVFSDLVALNFGFSYCFNILTQFYGYIK